MTDDIVMLGDGQQVLDHLGGGGQYEGCEPARPLLMLLDLNLPQLDGDQLLRRIKAEEDTRLMPVVVLSTTDEAADVARCYQFGCCFCVTKPVDYARFSEAIRRLGLFLSIITIPDGE